MTEIEQYCKHYYKGSDYAILESKSRNRFYCKVHDKLKQRLKTGDKVIVRIIKNKWIVTDISRGGV